MTRRPDREAVSLLFKSLIEERGKVINYDNVSKIRVGIWVNGISPPAIYDRSFSDVTSMIHDIYTDETSVDEDTIGEVMVNVLDLAIPDEYPDYEDLCHMISDIDYGFVIMLHIDYKIGGEDYIELEQIFQDDVRLYEVD